MLQHRPDPTVPQAWRRAVAAAAVRLILMLSWMPLCSVAASTGGAIRASLQQDGARLELITQAGADHGLRVYPLSPGTTPAAMFGRVEVQAGRLVFIPVVPFAPAQRYRAEWVDGSGAALSVEFGVGPSAAPRPSVQMFPQSPLPANALKFYLRFSQPMEQGVFLDLLRIFDEDGREITGPFRETELWSPDGRRLTVWFHPGRQKTGVNLNAEEGPVLRPLSKCTLVVSGAWRDNQGTPMGGDARFTFATRAADHEMPAMTRWKIEPPAAGTRDALRVIFDEPLDHALLASALSIRKVAGQQVVACQVQVSADAGTWTAVPREDWQPGGYELHADPLLEDLAGNSLTKLFEVDLAIQPNSTRSSAQLVRSFVIE